MENLNSNYGNENQYDCGVVYYREKRKLRSPPGYEIEKKAKFNPKIKISLRDGSLLKMCYRYISENLEILESLVGLPEIVGKNIIDFMLDNGNLQLRACPSAETESKAEKSKLQCLRVFDEAFPKHFLKSLSLTFFKKQLANLSDLLLCFENIEELDLSGNSLNDKALAAVHNLQCLKTLILVDCCLSDFSVKKLTLPYRLYNHEIICLEVLNLQGNKEITINSIGSLFIFPDLKILNVSGTRIKENDLDQTKLANHRFHFRTKPIEIKAVTTQGWAKPIIDYIVFLDCDGMKSIEKPTTSKRNINFYSSVPKSKRNSNRNKMKSEELINHHLFIVRNKNDSTDSLFTQTQTQNLKSPSKRFKEDPNSSKENDAGRPVVVTKSSSWLNFDDDDDDDDDEDDLLLSQYSI